MASRKQSQQTSEKNATDIREVILTHPPTYSMVCECSGGPPKLGNEEKTKR